ncbi:MAG: hypothetical protein HFH87_02980 [Lachnospiraceae bacterium]|nr:hypothetical protein [Lachnospiraceae bacterium]
MILKIISEEADAFFQGQKTAEAVADVIQCRVMLYMEENRSRDRKIFLRPGSAYRHCKGRDWRHP